MNEVFIPENFVRYVEEIGIIGNTSINDVGSDAAYQLYYLIIVFCVMFLIGTTLICVGPFQSGFFNVYKNIARSSGVDFFHDLKKGIKDNLKQSLVHMLITLALTAILLLGIAFYSKSLGRFGTAVSVLFFVLLLFLIIISNFVHYLIVCVDLPLKKIYKNAILFFFIKLFPCLGLLLMSIVLLLVIPCVLLLTTTYFAYAIAVIYYLTFAFCFCQYAFSFLANEMVDMFIAKGQAEEES